MDCPRNDSGAMSRSDETCCGRRGVSSWSPPFAFVRLIPDGLCGTIGGQVIESWKTERRFVPHKTSGPPPPNTMFARGGQPCA
jgi:hypothetical protein